MAFWLLYLSYAAALQFALALRARPLTRVASDRPSADAHRVLIIGATGGTGRWLVAQALERGFTVTALVRNPAALTIAHERLQVLKGDVLDPAGVDAAVRGQDAVVSALGHKRFFSPTHILSRGTANILSAMSKHGVRRLVCATSLGIGDSVGRLGVYYSLFVVPVILPLYFWDKARQERLIAESATTWVIVRPAALSNAAGRGRCRHGHQIGSYVRTLAISRADVARFMLDQLSDRQYWGTTVGLVGASS